MEIYPPVGTQELTSDNRAERSNHVGRTTRQAQSMGLTIRSGAEWNPESAALCGGFLGAVAMMLHEAYTVLFGLCLPIDPFTHVLAELAMFAPGGAMLFAAAANTRNRHLRTRSESVAAEGPQEQEAYGNEEPRLVL